MLDVGCSETRSVVTRHRAGASFYYRYRSVRAAPSGGERQSKCTSGTERGNELSRRTFVVFEGLRL